MKKHLLILPFILFTSLVFAHQVHVQYDNVDNKPNIVTEEVDPVVTTRTTNNKVWKTDELGVAAWRDDASGSFSGTLDDIATGYTNVHLTTTLKSSYDTAVGWGDHSLIGYVTGTPWTGMGYVTGTPWTGMGYLTVEFDPTNNNARYTTIKSGAGSHIATKVAGNYIFPPAGGVMAVGGTGTLYPQQVFYLTGADYPTINGVTTKLRIKGSVFCNDVAPFTGTFTFGLHPITRPGTSGGVGVCIYTIGTVVSGSTAVVTNAAADSSNNVIGSDFVIPADGWYALVCVTSATMATSAHVHLTCELQMRNQ